VVKFKKKINKKYNKVYFEGSSLSTRFAGGVKNLQTLILK